MLLRYAMIHADERVDIDAADTVIQMRAADTLSGVMPAAQSGAKMRYT